MSCSGSRPVLTPLILRERASTRVTVAIAYRVAPGIGPDSKRKLLLVFVFHKNGKDSRITDERETWRSQYAKLRTATTVEKENCPF